MTKNTRINKNKKALKKKQNQNRALIVLTLVLISFSVILTIESESVKLDSNINTKTVESNKQKNTQYPEEEKVQQQEIPPIEQPQQNNPQTPSTPISNNERDLRDIENLKNKKIIMFTFDDGPSSSTTPRLLDELKKRDVKATFFVIGNRLNKYSDIIKRQYMDGHTVANHSYSHRNLTEISDAELLYEMNTTNKLLNDILGINNKYMRPPGGGSNDHLLNVLNSNNLTSVRWSVDPRDWEIKDANKVYDYIVKNAKDGAIVLVHDLYDTSIDGAIRAIDELLRQGYALISLEEAEQLGYINTSLKTFSYLK